MTDKLLTVREVAEVFRNDVATVRSWIHSGRMTCLRLGGGRSPMLVPQSEIDRLIEEARAHTQNLQAKT